MRFQFWLAGATLLVIAGGVCVAQTAASRGLSVSPAYEAASQQ